jgi:PAS domain S-box-containing protein
MVPYLVVNALGVARAMSDQPTRRIHLLCVDDEPGFADVSAEMLEQQDERIDATGVTDPSEAIGLLEETKVDCVVSDYDMPEIDGLELLDAVRDSSPSKPFILFTGRGSEELASEAISRGVTDYIQKETGTEQYEILANRCIHAVEKARHRQQRIRAEEWYFQLFDQSLIGVGLSQNGVYKLTNDFFALILGRDPDDVVGTDVMETVAPKDRDRVRNALQRRESGGTDQVRYTVDVLRTDGTTRTVDVLGGQVMYDNEPAVLGLIKPIAEERSLPGPVRERLALAIKELEDTDGDQSSHVQKAVENLQRTQELLSEQSVLEQDDKPETMLSEAAREAWELVGTSEPSSIRITDDSQIAAGKELLVQMIEQILLRSIGSNPAQATVEFRPRETGFEMHIEAPEIQNSVESPILSDVQSPPDPLFEPRWCQNLDVYSSIEGSDAVVYEVVIESML